MILFWDHILVLGILVGTAHSVTPLTPTALFGMPLATFAMGAFKLPKMAKIEMCEGPFQCQNRKWLCSCLLSTWNAWRIAINFDIHRLHHLRANSKWKQITTVADIIGIYPECVTSVSLSGDQTVKAAMDLWTDSRFCCEFLEIVVYFLIFESFSIHRVWKICCDTFF